MWLGFVAHSIFPLDSTGVEIKLSFFSILNFQTLFPVMFSFLLFSCCSLLFLFLLRTYCPLGFKILPSLWRLSASPSTFFPSSKSLKLFIYGFFMAPINFYLYYRCLGICIISSLSFESLKKRGTFNSVSNLSKRVKIAGYQSETTLDALTEIA